MPYVSEQGSASDYLRQLAAQIDDGLIDVVCMTLSEPTHRLHITRRDRAFTLTVDCVELDVGGGVAMVRNDDMNNRVH